MGTDPIFSLSIARQKSKAFTGFRGVGSKIMRATCFGLQRVDRFGHRKIGLSGAGGPIPN